MTVFLILYECTWSSSIMSLLYFLFELVLPVNEGESVRGGTALTQRQRVDCPLGEEPILRHSDFSVFPDTGDNIPALLEYTHRFFRKEHWRG